MNGSGVFTPSLFSFWCYFLLDDDISEGGDVIKTIYEGEREVEMEEERENDERKGRMGR